MSLFLLVLGLIMFVGLVVVHEFGHFIAARRGGVDVEEFGIGFPPKAWGRKLKSGLLFTINWLPLGGFVKLKGEHDSATAKGSFGAAPLRTKVRIMLAGVVMNLATAFVILTFLALVGMPKALPNQFTVKSDAKKVKNSVLITYVEVGSPADKAGLKLSDRVVSIGNKTNRNIIYTAENLTDATKMYAGQEVEVRIVRDGVSRVIDARLLTNAQVEASQKTDQPKGYLGVAPRDMAVIRSTWSAPIVAAGLMTQVTAETFRGLGSALWNVVRLHGGEASKQVSGPVGILVLLKEGSLIGYQFMLLIIAIISMALAIMNILPIPALDGGRLFVTLLYRKILKKPLTKEHEEAIHGTGFAVLMVLFVVITFVDIRRGW